MTPRILSRALLPLALACLLLTPPAASHAAPFSGAMSEDGTALFLPDGLSPDHLTPSVALVEPPKTRGPLPAGWTLRPEFSQTTDGKPRVTLTLPAGTSLYGEGEVTGPLLRNGTDTVLWNTDNGDYQRDHGRRLYQSHPWVLGVRPDGTAFGFLADTTFHSEIKTTDTAIDFVTDGPAFPVILIDRSSPQEVMGTLARLIGTAPLPPRWALGYHQCRYSYEPDARVREIADTFRARQIPCDVIWMDIDYMDGYRIFTFDPKKFPDPSATNAYLHDHGFHSVWMIDPGVKKEKGYPVFDGGNALDAWIENKDDTGPFVGPVWPGACVFPDFTRPDVRRWWAGLYKPFMATGIDGVWNDMNEPAIFGTPDATMDNRARLRGGDGLPADTMARYHNVFGLLEVMASRAGIQAANPDKRPFVLSRSGYLGSQRYAATWTGDNASTWQDLKLSIPMSLSLGLAGQPMSGPDCGGFQRAATPELWANWIAVDAFFPFSRGHSDKGSPAKEPWAFGEETENAARVALQRRYRLLPYLYTLFHEHTQDGLPVMRPVFFADPKNADLRQEEQAFLVGADLLVIPQWATDPHLPVGWVKVEIVKDEQSGTNAKYQPEVRLRPGSVVPLGEVVQNTNEESFAPLTLLVCPDEKGDAAGTLYEDAGDGYGYQHDDYLLTTYHAHRERDYEIVTATTTGKRTHPARKVNVRVATWGGVYEATATDGETVKIPCATAPVNVAPVALNRPSALTDLPEYGARTPDTIQVTVSGQANRPGIYHLPPGAKIGDAIESAQGLQRLIWWGYSYLVRPVYDDRAVIIRFTLSKQSLPENVPLQDGDRLFLGYEIY